jgi:hypothetical protein
MLAGPLVTYRLQPKFLFRLCVSVFVFSWLLRLGIAFATDRVHEFSRMDMERVALSLVNRGVLGNPFQIPTGPTAILPPGYVLVLAAIFRLLGTGVAAEMAKILLCTGMASLRCALVPWLADAMRLGRAATWAAAGMSVIWIGAIDTELQGDWDAPITAVLVILAVWLAWVRPRSHTTPVTAVWRGLLWGAMAILNPATLSIVAVLTLLEFAHSPRRTWWATARRSAVSGACVVFLLLPWGVRNRIALGQWIWLRDGLGLELELSYHDGSSWSNAYNIRPSLAHPELPNRDSELSHHPFINRSENMRVVQLGEVEYFRQKQAAAIEWIRRHPKETAALIAQHIRYFWLPPGAEAYTYRQGRGIALYTLARQALTVAAFAGLMVLWRQKRQVAQMLGAILLVYPLVYYLVNWSSRYRAPIEWILVLLAAVVVGAAIEWKTQRAVKTTAAAV